MTLLPDWKRVARKAWSVRLNAVGFVFIGAEAALPFFIEELAPRPMALIAAVIVVGSLIARLLLQKGFDH